MIKSIGDFLLSSWLWGITFDFAHIFLGAFVLFIFIRLFFGKKTVCATLLSTGSYFFSFLIFSLIAIGIFQYVTGGPYEPNLNKEVVPIDTIFACISLAVIYTTLQTFFFFLVYRGNRCTFLSFTGIVVAANALAAMVSYVGIRLFMWYAI